MSDEQVDIKLEGFNFSILGKDEKRVGVNLQPDISSEEMTFDWYWMKVPVLHNKETCVSLFPQGLFVKDDGLFLKKEKYENEDPYFQKPLYHNNQESQGKSNNNQEEKMKRMFSVNNKTKKLGQKEKHSPVEEDDDDEEPLLAEKKPAKQKVDVSNAKKNTASSSSSEKKASSEDTKTPKKRKNSKEEIDKKKESSSNGKEKTSTTPSNKIGPLEITGGQKKRNHDGKVLTSWKDYIDQAQNYKEFFIPQNIQDGYKGFQLWETEMVNAWTAISVSKQSNKTTVTFNHKKDGAEELIQNFEKLTSQGVVLQFTKDNLPLINDSHQYFVLIVFERDGDVFKRTYQLQSINLKKAHKNGLSFKEPLNLKDCKLVETYRHIGDLGDRLAEELNINFSLYTPSKKKTTPNSKQKKSKVDTSPKKVNSSAQKFGKLFFVPIHTKKKVVPVIQEIVFPWIFYHSRAATKKEIEQLTSTNQHQKKSASSNPSKQEVDDIEEEEINRNKELDNDDDDQDDEASDSEEFSYEKTLSNEKIISNEEKIAPSENKSKKKNQDGTNLAPQTSTSSNKDIPTTSPLSKDTPSKDQTSIPANVSSTTEEATN